MTDVASRVKTLEQELVRVRNLMDTMREERDMAQQAVSSLGVGVRLRKSHPAVMRLDFAAEQLKKLNVRFVTMANELDTLQQISAIIA